MRRQAVMHMHRLQIKRMLTTLRQQEVEQRHRVEPARQRQRQTCTGRNVAGKAVRHRGGGLI